MSPWCASGVPASAEKDVQGCGSMHVHLDRLRVQANPTACAPSARCTCMAPLSRRRQRGPSHGRLQ
eukprot:7206325-Alexandrium_andersonii.AAC.1